MKPLHKKLLVLFAVYLLFSVIIVAFDHHGPVPDKKCAICSMGSSLFSAIHQSSAVPEIVCNGQYLGMVDHTEHLAASVAFSDIVYRGPPRTATTL